MPFPSRPRERSLLVLALVLSSALGCARAAPPPSAADALRVSNEPPAPGAVSLGPVRAVDGEGCGVFGTMGSEKRAMSALRHEAQALGADYVRITKLTKPYADHACVHKEYAVEGVAYRSRSPEAPTPPAEAAPAPAPRGGAATDTATLPAHGLSIGPSGCSLRASGGTASRSVSFSARLTATAAFGLWIDRELRDGKPVGLELQYDAATGRLSLAQYPDGVTVTIASSPLPPDEKWHEFRVLRAPDRVSAWVNGKVMLLYAAATPTGEGSFTLEGDSLEVRRLLLDAAGD